MDDDAPDLPRIAGLLADPARAKILWSLIGGTTRPAGELAYCANISAQSASGHLAKLVRGGLLACERQGRHRYFRIASAEIASAVDALALLGVSSRPRQARPPLPASVVPAEFLHARTCYEHLAGETAVKVLEGMLKARWLAADGNDFTVTALGERKLGALGVDLARASSPRRVFARTCVDLTERRAHLGGALGDALLQLYLERGWVLRQRRSRVVHITPKGRERFRTLFGA
jgi:DNA-binding transcriptional ArsR family regulator